MNDGPKKHAKKRVLYQAAGGAWRLTPAEKKRILTNNIYGVDIDPQAVEVTKLSLLLKVLEGETQLSLFEERALPDLANNIKCGNSLIGTDFYDGRQMSLLDEEERQRINPFDWDKEFPEIMSSGGFHAVIGNPPYVRQEGLGEAKAYFHSHYETFRPTADLYVNFIEKGLRLLKKNGLFGMIVSNKWLRAAYGQPLRSLLTTQASVLQVIDFAGLPVFADATVRTVILICAPRAKQVNTIRYLAPVSVQDFRTISSGERLQELANQRALELPSVSLSSTSWSLSDPDAWRIVERIRQRCSQLQAYIEAKPLFGIKTGLNKAFVIDHTTYRRFVADDPQVRRY